MAEDEDEDEDAEEEEEGSDDEDEDGDAPKKGGKGKLLIIVGVALLLVIGGAAAAYFTGLLDSLTEMAGGGGEEGAEESADLGEAIFYELPELMVNLNTTGRKQIFLKMRISLELRNPEDIPTIEGMMPRIIDNFQAYVRELRLEDLKGSAGMYRLREAFLTRVIAAAGPTKVSDVLFKEMLIQ